MNNEQRRISGGSPPPRTSVFISIYYTYYNIFVITLCTHDTQSVHRMANIVKLYITSKELLFSLINQNLINRFYLNYWVFLKKNCIKITPS